MLGTDLHLVLGVTDGHLPFRGRSQPVAELAVDAAGAVGFRSEEHTSELQSLMRISYVVFCLQNKPTTLLSLQYLTTTTDCHRIRTKAKERDNVRYQILAN